MGDGWVSMNDVLSAAEREATDDAARLQTMRMTDGERFPCDLCDEVWADESERERHRQTAHPNMLAGRGVACGVGDCPKVFEDAGRAGLHRRFDHDVSAAQAREMGLSGPSRSEARAAPAVQPTSLVDRILRDEHECPECERKCTSAAGLASHRRAMHGVLAKDATKPGPAAPLPLGPATTNGSTTELHLTRDEIERLLEALGHYRMGGVDRITDGSPEDIATIRDVATLVLKLKAVSA